MLLSGCSTLDVEHTPPQEQPVVLGPRPTLASRWRNTCAVETEQQLRAVQRKPASLAFWYQTPELEGPLYPPNLTYNSVLGMNRCHIQGVYRIRADGYLVMSANSQDQPRGEGDRKWKINNCPSLPTGQGGGALLFIAELADYETRPGYPWGPQEPESNALENPLINNRIVESVLLSVDEGPQPPDVGSLVDLYHPGGLAGVGDFLYVGIDGEEQASYLKILDMADPKNPILVGGRGFPNHKAQAIGATDLADGRILLAVVDTNRDVWKVHFYIEVLDNETGEIGRHRFVKAGEWVESDSIGRRAQEGFPFLMYQGLALVRECASDEIYFIGVHNDRRIRCGGKFKVGPTRTPSRVDMYRVRIPATMGPDGDFEFEPVLRRNLRDQKGEGCAGATVHITPEGQLTAYTIEHGGRRQSDGGVYDDGIKRWVGRVPFYEYKTGVTMAVLDDGDGVAREDDLCPDEAEDLDGFRDGDGCPDLDNDRDGVPDSRDLCPDSAEDPDGINDADGCIDPEGQGFFGKKIVLAVEKLFSDEDGTELSEEARFLMRGIVEWWLKTLTRQAVLCVTAHTNYYGEPEVEFQETERWATVVADHLVDMGLRRAEVSARGVGSEELLIAPSDSDALRVNVRVEFSLCAASQIMRPR